MSLDADFAAILDGQTTHEETKAFLSRSVELMGDPSALAAGARALRERMVHVAAPAGAIDVCGTGGDGAHTLNVSTAVAFVVAGCGVTVAKHGNRAMSSKSGAADVLEALGATLTGDVPTLERCLREAKVAFLFAQNHHPAMRFVAAARRELGQRTIFNLLGPLSNPAGATRQLLGVFAPQFVTPMAEALRALGGERAWVVHGFGGLDELSGEGENLVVQLEGSGISPIKNADSAGAGVAAVRNASLRGGSADENAAALRGLLERRAPGSDYEQVVLLNAAAALVLAGMTNDLRKAGERVADSLRSGAALTALDRLIALTKGAP
jgi:anthranilate phosphoribosyltransferase